MKKVPDEIVVMLQALEQKKTLKDSDKVKLDSFLTSLESGIVNPACKSKILVNPLPNEVTLSEPTEKTLEERIRHINTVSARVRASMRPETPEEAEDFDIDDTFDLLPKSIFEIADHETTEFVEEVLEPIEEVIVENPDLAEPPPQTGGEAE